MSKAFKRRQTAAEIKSELYANIKKYEKLAAALNRRLQYSEIHFGDSSDDEVYLTEFIKKDPNKLRAKKEDLKICLAATNDLSSTNFEEYTIQELDEGPGFVDIKENPGKWKKVTTLCKHRSNAYKMSFIVFQPDKPFRPQIFDSLNIEIVAPANNAALNEAAQDTKDKPSHFLAVADLYLQLARERKDTLKKRLHDITRWNIEVEEDQEGSYILTSGDNERFAMEWRIAYKKIPCKYFHQDIRVLENEAPLPATENVTHQLENPDLSDYYRMRFISEILEIFFDSIRLKEIDFEIKYAVSPGSKKAKKSRKEKSQKPLSTTANKSMAPPTNAPPNKTVTSSAKSTNKKRAWSPFTNNSISTIADEPPSNKRGKSIDKSDKENKPDTSKAKHKIAPALRNLKRMNKGIKTSTPKYAAKISKNPKTIPPYTVLNTSEKGDGNKENVAVSAKKTTNSLVKIANPSKTKKKIATSVTEKTASPMKSTGSRISNKDNLKEPAKGVKSPTQKGQSAKEVSSVEKTSPKKSVPKQLTKSVKHSPKQAKKDASSTGRVSEIPQSSSAPGDSGTIVPGPAPKPFKLPSKTPVKNAKNLKTPAKNAKHPKTSAKKSKRLKTPANNAKGTGNSVKKVVKNVPDAIVGKKKLVLSIDRMKQKVETDPGISIAASQESIRSTASSKSRIPVPKKR